MPVRNAQAVWEGDLLKGRGRMAFGSGAFEGQYSFSSRFEEGVGTNPEELIAAAHAGCFSMAFSNMLAGAGFTPTRVETTAKVRLEKVPEGFKITRINLETVGEVPNISEEQFLDLAEGAKKGCPVSQLLTGAEIILKATLKK
jgi:osmotically inducible protein OsmC